MLTLRRLLTKDPKRRPEAREALKHPWLKTTNKQGASGKDAMLQCVSNEVLQNLSIFAASNKLQRAFMHLAVSFMNKAEMQKMLAMFSALSTDQTKLLSTAEMSALLTRDKTGDEAVRIRHTIEVRPFLCLLLLPSFLFLFFSVLIFECCCFH